VRELSINSFAIQRLPFLGLFAAQRVIVSRFHSAVAPMRASGCGTLWRLTQLRHVVTAVPRTGEYRFGTGDRNRFREVVYIDHRNRFRGSARPLLTRD
jgi:hypothetical protein